MRRSNCSAPISPPTGTPEYGGLAIFFLTNMEVIPDNAPVKLFPTHYIDQYCFSNVYIPPHRYIAKAFLLNSRLFTK